MMIDSLKIVKMFGRIGKISRTRKYCSNSKSQQPIKFLSSTACDSKEPPELPSTCCMSGCANCVWLDFAEETVKFYDNLGMKMELEELLKTVDDNIQDPLVKAFIKM